MTRPRWDEAIHADTQRIIDRSEKHSST